MTSAPTSTRTPSTQRQYAANSTTNTTANTTNNRTKTKTDNKNNKNKTKNKRDQQDQQQQHNRPAHRESSSPTSRPRRPPAPAQDSEPTQAALALEPPSLAPHPSSTLCHHVPRPRPAALLLVSSRRSPPHVRAA
eukprot:1758313-Rhodomonas_salina.1